MFNVLGGDTESYFHVFLGYKVLSQLGKLSLAVMVTWLIDGVLIMGITAVRGLVMPLVFLISLAEPRTTGLSLLAIIALYLQGEILYPEVE